MPWLHVHGFGLRTVANGHGVSAGINPWVFYSCPGCTRAVGWEKLLLLLPVCLIYKGMRSSGSSKSDVVSAASYPGFISKKTQIAINNTLIAKSKSWSFPLVFLSLEAHLKSSVPCNFYTLSDLVALLLFFLVSFYFSWRFSAFNDLFGWDSNACWKRCCKDTRGASSSDWVSNVMNLSVLWLPGSPGIWVSVTMGVSPERSSFFWAPFRCCFQPKPSYDSVVTRWLFWPHHGPLLP